MDRNSFLRCQSFLYPLSLSSVRDNIGLSSPNDSNTNTAKCCYEVLLDDMNLSIEPCENTSFRKNINSNKDANQPNAVESNVKGRGIGPAYFLPQKVMTTNPSTDGKIRHPNEANKRDISSEDSSTYTNNYGDNKFVGEQNVDHIVTDPTFCKVQLILQNAKLPLKGMTTPVKKANRRDVSEIEDQAVGNDEAILIAKIDANYFQVDLNRVHSISIGQSEDKRSSLCSDDTNGVSNTNLITEISSCLILEFPSCCFRIFPSKPPTKPTSDDYNMIEGPDDYRSKFDAVRNRLERFQSDDCLFPFPLSYSGLTAPSGQILEPDVINKCLGEDNAGDPLGCSRRCLQAYSQSWKHLILFDDALENPYAEPLMGSTREKKFKDTVNHLMTKIPKQVSLSFMEEDKWTKALELYENKITKKIEEFDGVIDDFWNETSDHRSNNKRRRNDEDSDKCQSMIQHNCAGRFADILKDHKRYIISKHELYLLPLRG